MHLVYEAAPGCPLEETFFAEVMARTARAHRAPDAAQARTFIVTLKQGDKESTGNFRIRTPDGSTTERDVAGDTCAEVASALALIAALAVDSGANLGPLPLAFTNVTMSGNVATAGIGGAICLFSNGGTLTNCTLAGNQALGGTSSYSNFYAAAIFGGSLTLDHCILANDTTVNTEGRMQCAGGASEMGGRDVQWPLDKVAGGGADSACGITFADPRLGALQSNGGATLTMAPGAAASVVQIGTGCPATDQTGKRRASPCTIGALEN